jgi:hypothetical protein
MPWYIAMFAGAIAGAGFTLLICVKIFEQFEKNRLAEKFGDAAFKRMHEEQRERDEFTAESFRQYSRPEDRKRDESHERTKEELDELRRQFSERIRDRVNEKAQEMLREMGPQAQDWRGELAFLDDDKGITRERIKDRFRHLSKSRHPDNHGTNESYDRLVKAKTAAESEIRE